MPYARTIAAVAPIALLLATGAHAQAAEAIQTQYEVTELATDGVSSRGLSINADGGVAGNINRPDAQYRHAVLWRDGEVIDLGAFGGADSNSSMAWDGLNDGVTVVGFSQTNREEPNGEAWSCSAFFSGAAPTGTKCLGFAWTKGKMRRLRPFEGGENSYAAAVNASGQVVGWAENGVGDPSCVSPQVLQFRAAMWTATGHDAQVTELPPLGHDETSAATAINSQGDVVGISGACDVAVGRFSARHAVLWRKGKVRQIPTFGGVSWNTPASINDQGQVVGFANRPGKKDQRGEFNEHAFFWDPNAGLVDIGVVKGDVTSDATSINNAGVVVGYSNAADGSTRAFIWKLGSKPVDLNTLVVGGYAGKLIDARDINDAGEITGAALNGAGKRVAFVARPVEGATAGE
jgi:probable HAF family extracellular repeat protein